MRRYINWQPITQSSKVTIPFTGKGVSMNADILAVVNAAWPIFEKLKTSLERTHMNQFVAMEPTSGEYFAADTLSEAIGASRRKYPNRLAHAFRVGHLAALHFGQHTR